MAYNKKVAVIRGASSFELAGNVNKFYEQHQDLRWRVASCWAISGVMHEEHFVMLEYDPGS